MTNLQERLVPERSLRWIFLLVALWDLLGAVVELVFRSALFKLKDAAEPSGVLAARAFSGALFVTMALYLIAAWRPTKYRFILWLAVFEQLIAVVTGVFHGARSDIPWSGVIIPVAVAIALLVLLLLNFPRALPEEMTVEEEEPDVSAEEFLPEQK